MHDAKPSRRGLLALLGPGMMVAATGVGAGDIAGAGFAGSHIGYMVLWAAVLGAFIKFVINEGLTRWQLATGQTLLEGMVYRLGRPVIWIFIIYLLVWSFNVGSSLISACGVAVHALTPGLFSDPTDGKRFWGIAQSIIAVILILVGGYKRFEQLMALLLAIMFATVVLTAVMVRPDWSSVAAGLVIPRLPTHIDGGLQWMLALMGGVGGTLTVLCYGYWIREQNRTGPEDLRLCRIDLGVAYAFTALFGVAMIIICSGLNLAEGGGEKFMIILSAKLNEVLGPVAKYLFLIGAWGAVFTSLLGVWQAVPYLFCDFWGIVRQARSKGTEAPVVVNTRSTAYRVYLFALAIVPIIGLFMEFKTVQKVNMIFGAMVMPLLALALLIMTTRSDWIGRQYRSRPITVVVFIGVLLFFILAGILTFITQKAIVAWLPSFS